MASQCMIFQAISIYHTLIIGRHIMSIGGIQENQVATISILTSTENNRMYSLFGDRITGEIRLAHPQMG